MTWCGSRVGSSATTRRQRCSWRSGAWLESGGACRRRTQGGQCGPAWPVRPAGLGEAGGLRLVDLD
jgi:hypothetical protein